MTSEEIGECGKDLLGDQVAIGNLGDATLTTETKNRTLRTCEHVVEDNAFTVVKSFDGVDSAGTAVRLSSSKDGNNDTYTRCDML